MSPVEVIDIGRDALWTLIKISAPIMLVALFVGLIIALFQALTQIQEMTLTFVPKILAIFITLMIALPFMFEQMRDLNERLVERIVTQETIADIPIEPNSASPDAEQ
jgi:flagellar biosynthesis protein FliQ